MINFIIYEQAGKGKALKTRKKLEKRLNELNVEYTFHKTEKPGHAKLIAEKLSSEGAEIIVAVGGDGTIHEVLNGLVSPEKTTFGIIPSGTGNDFAAAAKIPSNPVEALELIVNGTAKPTDYFTCGNIRGMNIAGVGIDVDILKQFARAKIIKGKLQYLLSLIHCLIRYKPYTLDLTYENGEKATKKAFIACACNGTRFGGGIRISPESSPFDGDLELVVVNDLKRSKMLGAFIKLMKGKVKQIPTCESSKIKKITIDGKRSIQIDGEIYDFDGCEISIVSNQLKMYR